MSTEKIADFVVSTGYDRLPAEAARAAKEHILDGLAVALLGSVEPCSRMVVQHVKELGGKAEAGVIAAGFKTCAPEAALANGTMMHALDYDDYTKSWLGHPTTVLLPVILALGQRQRTTGKEALAAFVIGWEVGARVVAGIGGRLVDVGWHPTAVIGTVAAAATAAKLLKLNQTQVRNALGIAASETAGLRQNFGTDTKPFHAGNAARGGIVAAMLASRGFSANQSILESPLGLARVLVGTDCDLGKLTQGLGGCFDIASPGGAIKRYPSCAFTHRSIDAMLELVKERHLRGEEVAQVVCVTHNLLPKVLIYPEPKTGLEGKFSMQYCMAAAILDGEVTPRQFTDERVLSARAQELLRRVSYAHPSGEAAPTEDVLREPQVLRVKLHDGREYSHQVAFPKGDPENPLSWEEVAAKFRDCAFSLSERDSERVQHLVLNLESAGTLAELMQILTSTTP